MTGALLAPDGVVALSGTGYISKMSVDVPAERLNDGAPRREDLPGADLVRDGLADLAQSRHTDAALLVSIAEPRLRLLGFDVPAVVPDAEARLFDRLSERLGDGAHSAYNALIRRMVSFARAAVTCAK